MYEYFHVKVAANAYLFLADFRLTPNTGTSSTAQRRRAGAMSAFCLCQQTAYGAILEYDLIFEQEKK